ncbi:ABC transporter permease [Halobacterium wangiae]|uniref:ABC transporter permease n=1 Tax=Halobacterium wangiae TaxID=2902623 RepID=UPI001E3B668A|nr:ABC transporter permease [Halobacterium wangiae]
MPSNEPSPPEFTKISWEDVDQSRYRLNAKTIGLLLALSTLAALFIYDYVVTPDELFWFLHWDVGRMDWLFLISLVLFTRYALVPLAENRHHTLRYLRKFRSKPAGILSLAFLILFGVLGLLGPEIVLNKSYPRLAHKLQPPVFTSVYVGDVYYYNCVGELTNGYCHGTWEYPLGATQYGENIAGLLIEGMHVGLKLGLSTAMIMAVIATAVGTTAGYFGGLIDDILMRYVDFQQTIPAIVVYIVLATMFFGHHEGVSDGGLFSLALVFGLLDWGGMARLIRGEVLKRRSKPYIRAAEVAGASHLQIIRRHVIPNSTATIVTSLTRLIPVLILVQAALAFLELNRVGSDSLGRVLRIGLSADAMTWTQKWWVSTSAVVLLIVVMVAFNVFGDTVRDFLDTNETG